VRAPAAAKINIGLVVGPVRANGKHEVLTLYQRLGLVDRIELVPAAELRIDGFREDTLVREALVALARRAGTEPTWRVRIEKAIPVAAGLGGGSSDAATALRLANTTLPAPLEDSELRALAAGIGVDVPFFLVDGPQLGTGDGSDLELVDVPQDFWVVLLLPDGATKQSTADVYHAFDARGGADGWEERRTAFRDALGHVRRPRDLAALPPNDLATSPLADELRGAGAFRADVSGAGPALYGLFHHRRPAEAAAKRLKRLGHTWITAPAWYG
jgi:4-diphosphocytidyl-2-C-methyl-D-erythritol kinase